MGSAITTTDSAAGKPVTVLPVGSFEQHGRYLPLAIDTLIAAAIAHAICRHLHDALQLPPTTTAAKGHAALDHLGHAAAKLIDLLIPSQ